MSPVRPDRCNEPGPWGAVCSDWPGHRYSHQDASKDTSWQDDWQEDTPPEGGGTYDEGPELELADDYERNNHQ